MLAFLKIILRTFLFRMKRTLLTVLGITIGTTLILTLILLGEGMENALKSQLAAFGGDLIYISPGASDNPLGAAFSGAEIGDKELRTVRDVDGVEMAMGMTVKNFKVEFDGEEKIVNASGSPWEETRAMFEGFQGFEIADGDWPKRDTTNEVVLGKLVANERFTNPIRAGDQLVVKNKKFVVSGVLESVGNPDDDGRMYMSLDRHRQLTGERDNFFILMAQVSPGYDIQLVADDIRFELDRRRGVNEVSVFTSDSIIEVIGDVLGIVQLVLSAFAAVALIVGGVGIMNTMFTSVLERTREIGVMKALGATRGNILTLFVMESGLLGMVGGVLGIVISYGFAKLIEFGAASQDLDILKVDFDPVIVLLSLLFTFVVGVIFGLIPAWRGSKLKPTEALRYE